ncbi:MAG: putative DNA-binding domain-containing protein [Betaproteobacteria bacterium]|nr:MAG: putative DNA-binding domain-containing protein [Betaproteobacteria bacterium]
MVTVTSVDLARTLDVFATALRSSVIEAEHESAAHSGLKQLSRENPHIPTDIALSIYANNLSGGRAKALAVAYPACARILGAECFEGIARRYSESTAAKQPDLNLYGETFAEFLEERAAVLEGFSDYTYLGDLARLEWLCHVAYYANDDAPFDFDQLARSAGDAGEYLKLKLGDSVGMLQSDYPVMGIREVNLADDDAASVSAADCPQHLVVWRDEFQPCVERVDKATFDLLAAIEAGATLGDIASQLPHVAVVLSEAVPRLIQRGWISGIAGDESRLTETA